MYEYVFYLHRTCQACCCLHVYQVTHYCEPSCSKQAMQERSCKQRVACATMLSQVVVHAAGITQTHVCAGTARHWQSQVLLSGHSVSHPAIIITNRPVWCSISNGRALRVTTHSSQTQMSRSCLRTTLIQWSTGATPSTTGCTRTTPPSLHGI